MKKFISFLSLVLACLSFCHLSFADTRVRGYYKSNGTYVKPHHRSSSDGNKSNNWSTRGNTNPYTGKKGAKSVTNKR